MFHKGTAHLMPLKNIHQATPALDSSMGEKAQSVLYMARTFLIQTAYFFSCAKSLQDCATIKKMEITLRAAINHGHGDLQSAELQINYRAHSLYRKGVANPGVEDKVISLHSKTLLRHWIDCPVPPYEPGQMLHLNNRDFSTALL